MVKYYKKEIKENYKKVIQTFYLNKDRLIKLDRHFMNKDYLKKSCLFFCLFGGIRSQ